VPASVLEDDYYLARDLQDALEGAGATVLGPFGAEADARHALDAMRPDCALLDVNLGAGISFSFPDTLAERSIPFAFVTGYDRGVIPDAFAAVERLEKPVEPDRIQAAAARLLASG
jgi:DNA-binding NtrC family response regulator